MSERPAAAADDTKPLELAEKGRRGGQEISLDRRLFVGSPGTELEFAL